MIDTKQLKQLIKLMTDNDLTELDLRDGDGQVTLKRGSAGIAPVYHAAPPAMPAAAPPAATPGAATPAADAADSGLVEFKSPMVGTFYSAASPDAEPFVRVGSHMDANTVVCLIEAMKVFNEIKGEDVRGTIEKILVNSGEAVEFGQAMFLVRPD